MATGLAAPTCLGGVGHPTNSLFGGVEHLLVPLLAPGTELLDQVPQVVPDLLDRRFADFVGECGFVLEFVLFDCEVRDIEDVLADDLQIDGGLQGDGPSGPSPAPSDPVLVTGGNGYVASWLVRRLLELGFHVHATVRDPTDPRKTDHLNAIAHGCPGTLSLFRADLIDPDGFDDAMAGCALVFHTASPLIVRRVRDPLRDLVEPATAGTRHVLEAANRTPSVRRVVLTSSITAIYGDAADMEEIDADRFDESHWNTTSNERHQPYSLSKTLSERLAWELAGKQSRWDLVAVNPGLVLGPGLSPHTKAEGVLVMLDFGNGYYRFGAPDLEFAIVDVRDVAEGHLGPDSPRGRRDGTFWSANPSA